MKSRETKATEEKDEGKKNEEVVTIAKPTSAFLRAGPSLVPSPVTATTCRVSPTVLSMMPDQQSETTRT